MCVSVRERQHFKGKTPDLKASVLTSGKLYHMHLILPTTCVDLGQRRAILIQHRRSEKQAVCPRVDTRHENTLSVSKRKSFLFVVDFLMSFYIPEK